MREADDAHEAANAELSESLDARLSDLSADVESVDRRLDQVDGGGFRFSGEIDDLQSDISDLQSQIDSVQSCVRAISLALSSSYTRTVYC